MELDEHFEDFTAASDWELFISRLEQLLNEWMGKPTEPENITNNWLVVHEKITFADFPFKFTYYKRMDDNMISSNKSDTCVIPQNFNSGNNSGTSDTQMPPYIHGAIIGGECMFPPKYAPHIVSEYFNIQEFAVITSTGLEPVCKESKLKILLSSACIALNNTNCNFPIFVQFHHWSQAYFCGIAELSGIRSSFQMIQLKQNGNLPAHLSGLLDVFKSKIGTNLAVPTEISAHFFYKVNSFPTEINCDSFPPELFELLLQSDMANLNKEVLPWNQFLAHTSFLSFGSLDDPFLNLDFVAGWPSLTEDVVVDSSSYSDLVPENAQEWYFSLKQDTNAEFRLHDLVNGIWKLRHDQRTVEQVLGKSINDRKGELKYSSALEKITRNSVTVPDIPVAGINKVLSSARRQMLYSPDPNVYDELAPLSKEHMDTLIDFLFPDAKRNQCYPYPTIFNKTLHFQKQNILPLWESLHGIKSAPVGSLVWRLAVVVGYLLAYCSLSAVSHMWAEFVLELRYRLENSIVICGLELGSPNNGTCLFNQKLQMLNCCIDKKIARDIKEKERHTEDAMQLDFEESEEEDEFFDCEENVTEAEKINCKPVGRLRKNGRLRLLKTGEPMYIPITQDPAPLTEDVMEEQSKVMIELGDDAEASELRAKMMSASLLSDMESFKAANPGAELEDFVRWYSPRDWIETEEIDEFGSKVGELSPRMKVPGNLWLEVWSTAQSVPVRRQKRLFNDSAEAEKVLHWLGTRTLSDVSQLLFPCLIHAATLKVLEEADQLSFEYRVPPNLIQHCIQLTRCFSYVPKLESDFKEINNYKSIFMNILFQCEKEITQIKSFQLKFPSISVEEMLKENERKRDIYNNNEFFPSFIKVEGGKKSEVGSAITEMFRKEMLQSNTMIGSEHISEYSFGKPFKKVFVLRYNPPKSSNSDANGYSGLPQRMSCLCKEDMIILAGTFSSKTDLS